MLSRILLYSAQRILAYVDFPPMQISYKITRPMFAKFVAVVIFFIDGVCVAICIAFRPPIVKREGDIVKEKQVNIGIAMPGGLNNQTRCLGVSAKREKFQVLVQGCWNVL